MFRILLTAYLAVCSVIALADDRYWIGGSDNDNWTSSNNWSTTDGGSIGASVPTSSDDVYFTSNGNELCVVRASSECNNLTMSSGFTNTIILGDKLLDVSGGFSIAGGVFATSLAPAFNRSLDVAGTFAITGGTMVLRGYDYFRGAFTVNGGTIDARSGQPRLLFWYRFSKHFRHQCHIDSKCKD